MSMLIDFLMNDLTGAEIERYPIFSQALRKALRKAEHQLSITPLFGRETETLSVFFADNATISTKHITQTLH